HNNPASSGPRCLRCWNKVHTSSLLTGSENPRTKPAMPHISDHTLLCSHHAQEGRKADRAHIAVGASVVAAQRITSSAWKRSVGGFVRQTGLAVLRLMPSSNFKGCSTGRSAGLAPFKILPTYTVVWR